jgi:predicted MFS family arabinose efflux permease
MLDIRYFRNPAFTTGTAGMMLIFLGMYGVMFLLTQYFQLVLGLSALGAAIRLLPMPPIMLIVSPLTPRLSARFGPPRVVATGMLLVTAGFLLFTRITPYSAYPYVLACLLPFIVGMALTMSPMTASIMSAVPARRAGAGSAMNDASRELGAALGVAVLGSVAASRYASVLAGSTAHLPAAAHHQARLSLSGALQVAARLPHDTGVLLQHGADLAFVQGIHVACFVGATLAALATGLVLRYLPSGATVHADAHADADVEAPELPLEVAPALAE